MLVLAVLLEVLVMHSLLMCHKHSVVKAGF